jgi:type II secretory pathway pseudopilin PulG
MRRSFRVAFSLMELMGVIVILAIVAAYVIPRVGGQNETAKRNACWLNQGEIELQVRLWRRTSGTYPPADLSSIGSNPAYFQEGLPTCPVDGTSYTIDTTTGLVVGHTH